MFSTLEFLKLKPIQMLIVGKFLGMFGVPPLGGNRNRLKRELQTLKDFANNAVLLFASFIDSPCSQEEERLRLPPVQGEFHDLPLINKLADGAGTGG